MINDFLCLSTSTTVEYTLLQCRRWSWSYLSMELYWPERNLLCISSLQQPILWERLHCGQLLGSWATTL